MSPRRRPFRDNTRLILTGIAILVAVLVGLLALASRSATLAPDFLTEFVLYALSATNLTILVALVFVLARNIVKLFVEKRGSLPFAHFRAKLVAVLLGMTLIPAVLVLLVGSELIRNSVDRWFNAPMDDVLSSANAIAGDYYQERQRLVAAQLPSDWRVRVGGIDLSSAPANTVRAVVEPDVEQGRVAHVEMLSTRRDRDAGASDCSSRWWTSAQQSLPPDVHARLRDAPGRTRGRRLGTDAGGRAAARRRRPDSQRRRRFAPGRVGRRRACSSRASTSPHSSRRAHAA